MPKKTTGGFRYQLDVVPALNSRLLGFIKIGKIPKGFDRSSIVSILEGVPVPQNDVEPKQDRIS